MLGVSPPASPEPTVEGDPRAPEAMQDAGSEEKQEAKAAEKRAAGIMVQVQREWPFFTSMESCTRELDLRRVKTEHGGVNNCLLYSFSVASEMIHHRAQQTRCASHRNPNVTRTCSHCPNMRASAARAARLSISCASRFTRNSATSSRRLRRCWAPRQRR